MGQLKGVSKHPGTKFSVKTIEVSGRPVYYSCDQLFIESELERLTAGGKEVVAVFQDGFEQLRSDGTLARDLMVILKKERH